MDETRFFEFARHRRVLTGTSLNLPQFRTHSDSGICMAGQQASLLR